MLSTIISLFIGLLLGALFTIHINRPTQPVRTYMIGRYTLQDYQKKPIDVQANDVILYHERMLKVLTRNNDHLVCEDENGGKSIIKLDPYHFAWHTVYLGKSI